MPTLDFTFKYDIATFDARILHQIYEKKLQIRDISSYAIIDKLNDIVKMNLSVTMSEKYLTNLILERQVKMPVMERTGIITNVKKDSLFIHLTIEELPWHLSRLIFTYSNSKEFNFTNITIETALQRVIDSANLDTEDENWTLGEDIPTGNVSIKGKYKKHLDVLRLIAKNSGNDLWFVNRVIYIGKKGKTINVSKDKAFVTKITSEEDLNIYANKVYVIGKDSSGNNLEKTENNTIHDFTYNYERVIVNNNLVGNDTITGAATRLLQELDVSQPNININITISKFKEYNIITGDILKVIRKIGGVQIQGYYRVIKSKITRESAELTLEYSENGRFTPRLADSGELLEVLLEKVKALELN